MVAFDINQPASWAHLAGGQPPCTLCQPEAIDALLTVTLGHGATCMRQVGGEVLDSRRKPRDAFAHFYVRQQLRRHQAITRLHTGTFATLPAQFRVVHFSHLKS